jgi:hypothetical protein
MKPPQKDPATLERARADLTSAFEHVDRLAAENRDLETQLAARFVDVAALTRMTRRAEEERDAAVEERRIAVEQAASAKAELQAATVAHEAKLAALGASHDAQRAAWEAERVSIRQAAARRYETAVLALVGAAPWRWLPGRLRASAVAPLVRRTGLLDEEWYMSQYEDVATQGLDPVRHYVAYGAKEGRLANPDAAPLLGDQAAASDGGAERIQTDR